MKRLLAVVMVTTALAVCGGWTGDAKRTEASGQISCSVRRGGVSAILIELPGGQTARFLYATDGNSMYPGSTMWLSVDGRRFSGIEEVPLEPDVLSALRTGRTAYVAWTPWPSGVVQEAEVSLAGFAEAYDECLAKIEALRR